MRFLDKWFNFFESEKTGKLLTRHAWRFNRKGCAVKRIPFFVDEWHRMDILGNNFAMKIGHLPAVQTDTAVIFYTKPQTSFHQKQCIQPFLDSVYPGSSQVHGLNDD
jgi:hypothetical protein